MSPFDDETLSAWLDGGAEAATAAAIDRMLCQGDADLAARVDRLRRHDQLFAAALEARLGAPPERLRRIASGQIASIGSAASPRRRRFGGRALAAASLALVCVAVGLSLDVRLRPAGRPLPGADGLAVGAGLEAALSTAPTGAARRTPLGRLIVELSFISGRGPPCRVFHLAGVRGAHRAVACRAGGGWTVEGWAPAAATPAEGAYAAASGPDDPIERVVDRLGVASELDRAGEAAAIRDGWRSPFAQAKTRAIDRDERLF